MNKGFTPPKGLRPQGFTVRRPALSCRQPNRGNDMSEIRVITTGLRFPEGPVAMKDGSIVLVEIERQTITRVHPDGRTEIVATTGGGPNGLAIGPGRSEERR